MSNCKRFWRRFFIGLLASLLVVGLLGVGTVYYFVRRHDAVINSRKGPVVCYVAGRSGGHIIPALTLAKQFVETHKGARILFFSTNTQLDRLLIKQSAVVSLHQPLNLDNIPRHNWWDWPGYLIELGRVTYRILRTLVRENPERIISTGGYIAVPVSFVAKMLGIPITLYNLDVMPGAAIGFLSRIADQTIVCFDETIPLLPKQAASVRGSYPVRFGQEDRMSSSQARKILGIAEDRPVLLVFGGSQGSRFVNDLVPSLVKNLSLKRPLFILHQTGEGEVQRVRALYKAAGMEALVFAFRNDMNVLISSADAVIARAGAGSLFELAFFAKPSLIIPLETSITDHQRDNACAMAKRHPSLFTVFLQSDVEKDAGPLLKKLQMLYQFQ